MGAFETFLLIALVVIVAPGPDFAVTVRNTLLGGRRAGLLTAVGIAAGQLVWTGATGLGVVALLIASEQLLTLLKYAGAAVLLWLGAQALLGAIRPGSGASAGTTAALDARRRLGGRDALAQGFLSNIANPKMAAFFPSLLSQFVHDGERAAWTIVLLGTTFAALTLAWLALTAAAVTRAGGLLRRDAVRRGLEAATGTVLIALGARLVAEQR